MEDPAAPRSKLQAASWRRPMPRRSPSSGTAPPQLPDGKILVAASALYLPGKMCPSSSGIIREINLPHHTHAKPRTHLFSLGSPKLRAGIGTVTDGPFYR